MNRFALLMRLLLGLGAVILAGAGLKHVLTPQIIYDQGDTHITVTYSHLWTTGCVDVTWMTSRIEAVYVGGEGTVGEGTKTFCDAPYGPVVTVQLPGGAHVDYSRDTLWRRVETHLWLAALCLCLAVFWPRHISLLASICLLAGILFWISQGTPSLPLAILLRPLASGVSLGRVILLALLVPFFYWNTIPSGSRVPFLLGVGLLTFVGTDLALEYLLLLGVLIVWISALWPRPQATTDQSPYSVFLCGLALVLFAIGVVLSTSPHFNLNVPLIINDARLILLFVPFIMLLAWHIYESAAWRSFSKVIVGTLLVIIVFYAHLLPEAADYIRLLPLSTGLITAAALMLVILAFRIGPNLSPVQRQHFINGGIVLLLSLFILFKLPQVSVIGWAGFSYIAFRLLHVLLEHRQKTPLPELTTAQFGLYTTFFSAQQVGPIALLPQFGPQLQTEQVFSWDDYGEGWERILGGVIKKFFIADVLLSVILPGTVPTSFLTPSAAWVQLYAYAFYLYCDFSGFVDVALGLARLLGYRLPENFDNPYIKGSLAQFWQSWHITLSGWIRTYVYLPLSRSMLRTRLRRSSLTIVLIANLVTMLLIGLWHGFALRYVIWGVWHALGLFVHKAFSDQMRRRQIKWRGTWRAQAFHVFSVLLTFHFVVLGWVFFAFPSVGEAFAFLKKLAGLP